MALWDLLRATVRRWPIVVVGAILTLVAAEYASQDRSVYWTRTDLLVLAPKNAQFPNALRATSEDLVITAGVVGKLVAGTRQAPKFTATDAGLIGMGVRDGWTVRLPDTGGQWAPNYVDQWLIIEVVGPDPETVRIRKEQLVEAMGIALARVQDEYQVDQAFRMTTKEAPGSTVIYPVGGSSPRAFAVTGLLGAAATLYLVVRIDPILLRRRERRAETLPETDV
ncbi:hypothetical protein [Nocardioides sp.]|uniref:hypothetical protein n=1 Tax=Nocardioides sp. TaxID=35761 RepID=UPI00198AFD80|nr:hypothetical protein [Nocardioides sp.]MBC7278354.1 hypothetical protein [Nocardioides sp.]